MRIPVFHIFWSRGPVGMMRCLHILIMHSVTPSEVDQTSCDEQGEIATKRVFKLEEMKFMVEKVEEVRLEEVLCCSEKMFIWSFGIKVFSLCPLGSGPNEPRG